MPRYEHFAESQCEKILEYQDYLTYLMDDDIREDLHNCLQTDDFCTFFDAYLFEDPEFVFCLEEVSL